MLYRMLCLLTKPENLRDRNSVKRVDHRIIVSIFILTVCGAWAPFIKNSWVFIGVSFVVLMLALRVITEPLMLRKELSLRSLSRTKRLALPGVLADGIAAAEREDALKLAEVISHRIIRETDFSRQDLLIYDCLTHDLLVANPGLLHKVRKIGSSPELHGIVTKLIA